MVRNILGGVLGLVVGGLVARILQVLGYFAFPPGVTNPNFESQFSINAYMDSMSTALFVSVLAAYAAGSIVAGFIIGKIAESKGNLIPIIVGSVFMIGWILNLIMLRYPIWVAVVGFLMYIPFTILGKNLAVKSGSGPDDQAEDDDGGDVLSAAGTGIGTAVAGSAIAEAGSEVKEEQETGSVGAAGAEASAEDSGFVAAAGGEVSDDGTDSDSGGDSDSHD